MAKEKEEVKTKALDNLISTINKQLGDFSIIVGASNRLNDIEFISSGSISLNKALGGGWARGRIAEAFGPESTGKSTLGLLLAAEAQKLGETVAYIDAEHSLDAKYARALGVNMEELLIAQPDSGENGLEIVKLLSESGQVSVIIVDSVAALVPKAELEGEIGDQQMGLHARLMSKALRNIAGPIARNKVTVLFINQLRSKIGFVLGNPEVTTGGGSLKYYASQRVDIRTTAKNKDGEQIYGISSRVKIVKNKVAQPFKEAEFSIEFGKGINKYLDLLTYASNVGIIEKSGAWYSYEGERIGQGQETSSKFLEDHPKIYEEIFTKCQELNN